MRNLLYLSVGCRHTIPSVISSFSKLTWNLPWNGASPLEDQKVESLQNWKEVNMGELRLRRGSPLACGVIVCMLCGII